MSFGSEFPTTEEREAVEYAQSKGKLFFASVGNNAQEGNEEEYPAAYRQVVGVSAADKSGKVGEFSQHGQVTDIAAPGIDVPYWCDETFREYCDGDGTSQATAIAAASAALVWSAHPEWTANQVLNVLFDTAGRDWKKGTLSKYLGHGLIRPSMNILKGKGTPATPTSAPSRTRRRPVPQAPPPRPHPPRPSLRRTGRPMTPPWQTPAPSRTTTTNWSGSLAE